MIKIENTHWKFVILVLFTVVIVSYPFSLSKHEWTFTALGSLYLIFNAYSMRLGSSIGIYMSKEGIIKKVGKKRTIPWSDIQVSSHYNFILFQIVIFSSQGERIMDLCWITEDCIIEGTKKFAPPDSDFYKIVKNYSKSKEL
nr:hypothetical protein BHI3_15090 [Bacteriovorax sp. HI3]